MQECRLCSYNSDLISIFDPNLKNSQELRRLILYSAGVEIIESDLVSKLVCRRCCILVIKMYKYRLKCIANDKFLKNKIGQPYVSSADMQVVNFNNSKIEKEVDYSNETDGGTSFNKNHPSIEKIFAKYPTIILPPNIFKEHLDPIVDVDYKEITRYLILHYQKNKTTCDEFKNPEMLPNTNNKRKVETDIEEENLAIKRKKSEHNVAKKRTSSINCHKNDHKQSLNVAKKRTCTINYHKEEQRKSLNVTPISLQSNNSIAYESSDDFDERDFQDDLNSSYDSHIMLSLREADLFICKICNRVCDTKKQLYDHQRTHLCCKFCKLKLKNVNLLLEHLNKTCFISMIKNLPEIPLVPVDQDPEVIKNYSYAFESEDHEPPNIEEVILPIKAEDFIDESQNDSVNLNTSNLFNSQSLIEKPQTADIPVVDHNNILTDTTTASEKKLSDNVISENLDDNTNISIDTNITLSEKNLSKKVISENSDKSVNNIQPKQEKNDLLCQSTKIEPIVEVFHNSSQISQVVQSTQLMSGVKEGCFIEDMFRKYSVRKKYESSTQTFLPSNSSLIPTNSNSLICIENLFNELQYFTVPVKVNYDSSFGAVIEKSENQSKQTENPSKRSEKPSKRSENQSKRSENRTKRAKNFSWEKEKVRKLISTPANKEIEGIKIIEKDHQVTSLKDSSNNDHEKKLNFISNFPKSTLNQRLLFHMLNDSNVCVPSENSKNSSANKISNIAEFRFVEGYLMKNQQSDSLNCGSFSLTDNSSKGTKILCLQPILKQSENPNREINEVSSILHVNSATSSNITTSSVEHELEKVNSN